MTGQTVAGAVQRQDEAQSVGDLIARYQDSYAQVLPEHVKPEQWVRLAQGLLRRDANLADAARKNPSSFMAALLECARLGHEPGTSSFALVPFKDKNVSEGVAITGIEQYQGVIERMYRAGAIESVVAEIVYANDEFHWQPGNVPHHGADWFASEEARGQMVGVYAYAKMKGGGISRVVVMGKAEVDKHREVAKTDAIWRKWPGAMWRKTAVHELEKWVPTSAEYRREQLRAIAEADNVRRQATFAKAEQVDTSTGEIIDGEAVD